MKWMKERDLLIAQTMAFVQSVTGKTPETEKTVTTSVALLSVETSETIRAAAALPDAALSDIKSLLAMTPPAAQAPREVSREVSREVREEIPREISRPAPLRVLTCGRISSPRSGRGSPISAPIRSGSTASARPIAARPWRRSTLLSGKASRRRVRGSRPRTQNPYSPASARSSAPRFRARRRPAPCWPRRRPAGRRSA